MGNTSKQIYETKFSDSHRFVYKTLNLESDKGTSTENYLHPTFLQQLVNVNKKGFEPKWNPLCPMHMKISQNWMTCCFISPVMALVSPLYIFDTNQQFYTECEIRVFNGKQMESLKVKDAIMIKSQQLALLILEKPFLKVGWMGISYIKSLDQLKQNKLKIVNHPEKNYQHSVVHVQKVKQIQFIIRSDNQGQGIIIRNKDINGSIIIKIKSGIPSIVGIQISETEAMIFDKKLFKAIRNKARNYIDVNKKKIIQQMDETFHYDHELIIGA